MHKIDGLAFRLVKMGSVIAVLAAAGVLQARADGAFAQQERDPYLAMNKELVMHGCALCHGADYARVGPSMRDVATAYASNGPAGVKQVKNSILKGTKGHWGPAAMPPQVQVKPSDIDKLVATIMATGEVGAK